jgi:RNA polymerase sigma-70 factor (TIGR02957 family)
VVPVDEFERCRPLLFSIAYRMLGSAAEAEDVVQDTWLRAASARDSEVRSPRAYLTTIATRLALDRLKSARVAREEYVGPWLPEPLLTDLRPEPEQSLVLAESLSFAFLVLLETLSPQERAVFLLREAFEYSYAEIAGFLEASEASCRQLFHRARERLALKQSRSSRSRAEKRKLAERFVSAMRAGDRDELTRALAEDVGFWGDGGGRVVAARRPVLGREAVLNLLLGIRRTGLSAAAASQQEIAIEVAEVNYEPAMLVSVDGRLDSVYVFSFAGDALVGIRVVRNPDKLGYIRQQLAAAGRAARGADGTRA